jgi:hypothetical protein
LPPGSDTALYSPWGISLLLGVEHVPIVFLAARAALVGVPAELIEAARAARAFSPASCCRWRAPGLPPGLASPSSLASVVSGFRCAHHWWRGGRMSCRIELGRWRLAVTTALLALAAAITVLPLGSLVSTSLSRAYGVPLRPATATLGHFATVLSTPEMAGAFATSAWLSLVAGGSITIFSVPLAVLRGWGEPGRLNVLIQKGKAPARQQLKARILLKADASEAGEAWSDSEIAGAPDTSTDTVARTRQQFRREDPGQSRGCRVAGAGGHDAGTGPGDALRAPA